MGHFETCKYTVRIWSAVSCGQSWCVFLWKAKSNIRTGLASRIRSQDVTCS
jgi:hypothetical protein